MGLSAKPYGVVPPPPQPVATLGPSATNAGNIGSGVQVQGDTYNFELGGSETTTSTAAPAGAPFDWQNPWVTIIGGALLLAALLFYWRK